MITSPRFYLIGTKYARSVNVLPQMIRDGVVSTGFVDDLDLSPIIGKDYSETLDWIRVQIPQETSDAKATLALFACMRPGDLVALKAHSAPDGIRARLVIARYAVVAGNKKAIYARSDALGHTLKVNFLDEQEPIELPLGYGKTLHAIEDPHRINLIFGRYAQAAFQSESDTDEDKDKATYRSEVAARGAYLMQRVHNELQNEMRKLLIARYGNSAVKQEEGFIDLQVKLDRNTLLIEVKSSPSPISCIRKALGQLLQYSWKLRLQGREVSYLIVGPSEATAEDSAFITHVVQETNLPLSYCTPSSFATISF